MTPQQDTENTDMTTRTELMTAYRRALVASYAWATNDDLITSFMQSVKRTLDDAPGQKALLEGKCWDVAMKACGLPKRTSKKALRALPAGDELTLVIEPMYPDAAPTPLGKVIESKVWKGPNGRRASPYGACPWMSDAERPLWTLETQGWTVQHPDGTVGNGRPPFATRDEAEAWTIKHPRFPGMNQG